MYYLIPKLAANSVNGGASVLSRLHESDIRLLRVFSTIVECGGFSQAQIELNVSQSTISTQMSNLETRIGKRLCERGRTGFKLTDAGEHVYQSAQKMFASMRDFVVEVNESQKQLKGELHLGVADNTTTNPESHLAEAIAQYHKLAPDVTIKLTVDSATGLESKTLDGILHLAIGFFPHRIPSLRYDKLFREYHELYCGSRHPLFSMGKGKVTMRQIREAEYASRGKLESQKYMQPDLNLNKVAESDNIDGLAIFVLSGKYIAYLPTHYAQPWVDAGKIKSLLASKARQGGDFHVISRKASGMPMIAQRFSEVLHSVH